LRGKDVVVLAERLFLEASIFTREDNRDIDAGRGPWNAFPDMLKSCKADIVEIRHC
jgi:hypothetical protein